MDPITLDQNLARQLDEGMASGGATELPFPVVYLWVLNGQAGYKSQGGAAYFGGWACKLEDTNLIAETTGVGIPSDWKVTSLSGRDGSEFETYSTRSVIVAPIGKRLSWLDADGKTRSPEYQEGWRRHLQVLAFLAEKSGENGKSTYTPWGPVVLTAKGYQARNLLDAFSRWKRATASILHKVAPGVPAWCFYLALGTFGKERQVLNVGKQGAQSPITPATAYIPEKITDEQVRKLFVGAEVASRMGDYLSQAAEWLKAWSEPVVEAAGMQAAPEDDNFLMPDQGAEEDSIPF